MGKVFIIGCGYIGSLVGRFEKEEGSTVCALARSEEAALRLSALGIEQVRGDLDDRETLAGLPLGGKTVYYFAPPPSRGITDPRMENFTASMGAPPLPARVVLISTTGVYGDCQGAWVTEERPPAPQVDRARRRLSAEETLRRWGKGCGVPVAILRVPGIYGPGKLPARRLREGLPVLRETDAPFSNRIHAEDLARVCLAAARRGAPGAVYNVSDGHPTTMTDFFLRVADHLGIPRPPEISLAEARGDLTPEMLSYLAESKRISNRLMREELGVEPLYPDLASGLPHCREGDNS